MGLEVFIEAYLCLLHDSTVVLQPQTTALRPPLPLLLSMLRRLDEPLFLRRRTALLPAQYLFVAPCSSLVWLPGSLAVQRPLIDCCRPSPFLLTQRLFRSCRPQPLNSGRTRGKLPRPGLNAHACDTAPVCNNMTP